MLKADQEGGGPPLIQSISPPCFTDAQTASPEASSSTKAQPCSKEESLTEQAPDVRSETTSITEVGKRKREDEIVEASPRLAVHIRSPAKFNKVAEMAYQLLVTDRVTQHNSAAFFEILEAGVADIKLIRNASLRAAYQRLYAAAVARIGRFPPALAPMLRLWEVRVIAQLELLSKDTSHFERAARQVHLCPLCPRVVWSIVAHCAHGLAERLVPSHIEKNAHRH